MPESMAMNGAVCRLCGAVGVELAFELSGMPRWNHRLLDARELGTDRAIDLAVHRCASCGFVCVPMNLSDDYYDDYLNVPSLSTQARRFQTEQANEFVARFQLHGRKVLEVGCGDGHFLQALNLAGAECVGIEPSAEQRRLAGERGLSVESGILSRGRILPTGPFDAFVTRQVFEHVEPMRDFLLTIRANLRLGAVGLVEVPNLVKLSNEHRFFDFIPEHINYFTPRTLRLALELAGFEVVAVDDVDNGESLRALVQWHGVPDYTTLSLRVDSLRSDVAAYLADCRAKGKSVAIWGAGGKGLSMMAVLDLAGVSLLVDSNPGKLGHFTPVSHLRVEAPSELAARGIGAVIVMAPAFEREIAAKLRAELAFSGDIVLAGSGFQLFEPIDTPT